MSESPPNPGEFDDVDEHYRRVAALEKGGPSESVRRAVLEHAARLAAERVAAGSAAVEPRSPDSSRNTVVDIGDARRRAPRRTWWRPAALGTLAAAGLAGLLIAPQFLPPRESGKSASAPASAPPSVPPAAPESGAAAHRRRNAPRRGRDLGEEANGAGRGEQSRGARRACGAGQTAGAGAAQRSGCGQ